MFSLLVVLTVIGAAPGGTHSELSTSASVPANRTVSVHGVSLHYLDWGGTGEALVLLPAACETAHIYGDIAPAFTDRFRVLGPTTRGCGQSGRAPAYDLDTQLRELEVLQRLPGRAADQAGHSRWLLRQRRKDDSFRAPISVPRCETRHLRFGVFVHCPGTGGTGGSGDPDDSADLHRRYHEAWELGAWSAAMDRNLRETYEASRPEGALRPVGAPQWWTAFRADMKAGRYFETRISHPTLMFFAVDLDQERLKQFDEVTRADIRPLAEETDRRRRVQIEEFRKNGPLVRIIEMPATAHYCFVHKPQDVIREMRNFLLQESSR